MNNTQKENNALEDDFVLIDFIAIIAENIKLLVLGPLIIGAIALTVCYFLPKTFVSQSTLSIPANNKNPKVANASSYMSSHMVLEPIIKTLRLAENRSYEEAINDLRERLTISKTKEGNLQLEVKGSNPKEAQILAEKVISEWLEITKPNTENKDDLEKKLNQLEKELKIIKIYSSTGDITNRQSKFSNKDSDSKTIQEIIHRETDLVNEIIDIRNELKGISLEVIISPPSLPKSPIAPKKISITIFSIFGSLLLLLLLIFIRNSYINALIIPENEEKHKKILNALGLKNQ
jgi:uncharacterized protein involved in exopolysaccharide biosynthesis